MSKIENFNCEGLCQQEHCSEKYTHLHWVSINDLKVCILLCEEHHDTLLDNYLEAGQCQ